MVLEKQSHGTTDTIFKFKSHVIDNKSDKKITIAVFIDFKKAFDTLNHQILIQKVKMVHLMIYYI